jgi:hypothetical protein
MRLKGVGLMYCFRIPAAWQTENARQTDHFNRLPIRRCMKLIVRSSLVLFLMVGVVSCQTRSAIEGNIVVRQVQGGAQYSADNENWQTLRANTALTAPVFLRSLPDSTVQLNTIGGVFLMESSTTLEIKRMTRGAGPGLGSTYEIMADLPFGHILCPEEWLGIRARAVSFPRHRIRDSQPCVRLSKQAPLRGVAAL